VRSKLGVLQNCIGKILRFVMNLNFRRDTFEKQYFKFKAEIVAVRIW